MPPACAQIDCVSPARAGGRELCGAWVSVPGLADCCLHVSLLVCCCSSAAHAAQCKNHYDANRDDLKWIIGRAHPEKCIAQANKYFRVEFSAKDYKVRLLDGPSSEPTG